MLRRLREFFSSDPDPIVKVVSGLSEPEALMWKELLESNGVPALAKNMSFLSVTKQFGSFPQDFDLYVKSSDLEAARELLASLVDDQESSGPEGTRRYRKRPEGDQTGPE